MDGDRGDDGLTVGSVRQVATKGCNLRERVMPAALPFRDDALNTMNVGGFVIRSDISYGLFRWKA